MNGKTKNVKTTRPPDDVLEKIRERDTVCVYCGKKMIYPWSKNNIANSAEIEHLNHRKDWDSVGSYIREGKDVSTIVAYCCHTCNSDRRDQGLLEWFKTPYCTSKNIKYDTVAAVVRDYIDAHKK